MYACAEHRAYVRPGNMCVQRMVRYVQLLDCRNCGEGLTKKL